MTVDIAIISEQIMTLYDIINIPSNGPLNHFRFHGKKILLCQTFFYVYLCAYMPAFCRRNFTEITFLELLSNCAEKGFPTLDQHHEKIHFPVLFMLYIFTLSFWQSAKENLLNNNFLNSYFPEDLRDTFIFALAISIPSSITCPVITLH